MRPFNVVTLILLTLLGCGPGKRVEQSVFLLEKNSTQTSVRQAELAKKVDELSHTIWVLQDRIETMQLALERKAEPRPAPTPKKDVSRKTGKKSRDVAPGFEDSSDGEPFLFENNSGDRTLPTLKLTNEDLDRMDRKSSPEKPQVTAAPEVNEEAVQAYNAAFQKFEDEKYPEAIAMFEAFEKKFAKHEYADNAVFWTGECFFRLGDHAKALASFERVPREYPNGNKVPDALLRAGACYLRLNENSAAQKKFEQIINTYPQSVAAGKARTLMAELKKNQTQGRM